MTENEINVTEKKEEILEMDVEKLPPEKYVGDSQKTQDIIDIDQVEQIGDEIKSPITIKELLETGVHFGHQTNKWNPKMKPYIYGERNGIHIIDLEKTAKLFKKAYYFIAETVARGGSILFLGTKRQAQDIIAEEASRVGMFYVNTRWLGGTLTNFITIKASLERLKEYERMKEDGSFASLQKKEILLLEREYEKLKTTLLGIKEMTAVPSAIFVIDPSKEVIAIRECNRLEIPIIGLTDTNCDPEPIDFIIPGNDDAIRAIKLITSRIADACMEGQKKRKEQLNIPKETTTTQGNMPQVDVLPRRS